MTLLSSITSLIQYRPPGPSSIVLDRFYCILARQSERVGQSPVTGHRSPAGKREGDRSEGRGKWEAGGATAEASEAMADTRLGSPLRPSPLPWPCLPDSSVVSSHVGLLTDCRYLLLLSMGHCAQLLLPHHHHRQFSSCDRHSSQFLSKNLLAPAIPGLNLLT